MSTTSTLTALVACDQTVGDDPELANHICVPPIGRVDGTPFDADSLQEEDIVELCVGMGQVHPDGLLLLSVTESVMHFILAKRCWLQHVFSPWPQSGMMTPLGSVQGHLLLDRFKITLP